MVKSVLHLPLAGGGGGVGHWKEHWVGWRPLGTHNIFYLDVDAALTGTLIL